MNEHKRPAAARFEDAYLTACNGDVPTLDRHAGILIGVRQ
jgi:hypothetical protein